MSVLDRGIVDGIASDKEGEGIRLLITDHLDWSNEYHHLLALQEKNKYLYCFCEEQQYKQAYK